MPAFERFKKNLCKPETFLTRPFLTPHSFTWTRASLLGPYFLCHLLVPLCVFHSYTAELLKPYPVSIKVYNTHEPLLVDSRT